MLIKIALLFALRSLILLIFEKKSRWKKGIDALFIALYTSFFLLFLNRSELLSISGGDLIVLGMAILIGITLYIRLNQSHQNRPLWMGVKTIGFCLFLFLSAFSLLMRFQDHKAVMKVTLTGKVHEEWVEWKPPKGTLQNKRLKSYEVILETLEGKTIAKTYLFGEVIGIRVKVIRLHPLLNFIGFDNRFQIDAITNGYVHPQQEDPLFAYSLTSKMWDFWEKLFLEQIKLFWIQYATLETHYFPLIDTQGQPLQRQYFLKISSSGLSCF